MKLNYTLTLLGLLASTLFCPAQDNLSLSDAITLGLERNYDIHIEEKKVLSATNSNSWGEAGRMPTVNFSLNQNNNLQDNVETAIPTQTQGQIITNNVNPGVNLNWTLFSGFKINMNKGRLEKLQEQSQGNASIVISNTIQSIILGYYLAVLEKERLEEFEKQLTLSADKYQYVRVKAQLGSAVSMDVLLEEANYLTDSTNFLNQQLAYRNALRNFNFLLAETDIDKNYNFTDQLSDQQEDDFTFESLSAKLEDENIDLKNQYLNQSILKDDLRIRKADRYPVLGLNAGVNDNRQNLNLSKARFFTGNFNASPDGFASGPPDPLNSVTDTYFVNFSLTFTLYNGGKINRAIQNAIIQEDIGNLQTKKMKESLFRDLVSAYDQYSIRKQLYQISERRVNSTNTNLSNTEEKFKNGTINSFDYRTVQNTNLSAAIQRLQALYNLVDSKISLMRLTGGIISTYKE